MIYPMIDPSFSTYGKIEHNQISASANVRHIVLRERVQSGMANARAKGRRIGRPQTTKEEIPATFYRHYPSYKSGV